MSYAKETPIEIVRTRHKVIVEEGGSSKSIKQDLSCVPDEAKLLELVPSSDPIQIILYFEEEKEKEQEEDSLRCSVCGVPGCLVLEELLK